MKINRLKNFAVDILKWVEEKKDYYPDFQEEMFIIVDKYKFINLDNLQLCINDINILDFAKEIIQWMRTSYNDDYSSEFETFKQVLDIAKMHKIARYESFLIFYE